MQMGSLALQVLLAAQVTAGDTQAQRVLAVSSQMQGEAEVGGRLVHASTSMVTAAAAAMTAAAAAVTLLLAAAAAGPALVVGGTCPPVCL